jgi:hypothetical protein
VAEDGGEVVYVKECEVLARPVCRVGVVAGSHRQQVNCLLLLQLGGQRFLASAGEETAVRLHEIERGGAVAEVAMLRGHVSSVRCLAEEQDGDSVVLLSGGVQAEVRAWRLGLEATDGLAPGPSPAGCWPGRRAGGGRGGRRSTSWRAPASFASGWMDVPQQDLSPIFI